MEGEEGGYIGLDEGLVEVDVGGAEGVGVGLAERMSGDTTIREELGEDGEVVTGELFFQVPGFFVVQVAWGNEVLREAWPLHDSGLWGGWVSGDCRRFLTIWRISSLERTRFAVRSPCSSAAISARTAWRL
ncbi:MAG: hypothetical protein RI897_779 [Verrucomicrobiota bacterium]